MVFLHTHLDGRFVRELSRTNPPVYCIKIDICGLNSVLTPVALCTGSISIAPPPSRLLDNEYNFCGKPPPQIPAPDVPVDRNPKEQQQQQQNFNASSYRRRRQPPLQFRPQPLEPPPPPPALSVAFTAVACPWWTVLEGMFTLYFAPIDNIFSSRYA